MYSYTSINKPWAVYLIGQPNRMLCRFRSYSDAEAHRSALQRLQPNRRYEVVYDLSPRQPLTEIPPCNLQWGSIAPEDDRAN